MRRRLILSTPFHKCHHNDIYQRGKVYVYDGSSSGLSATPNWTATSDRFSVPEFGFSVASAGDVNGDGYKDIINGAPLYSNGQTAEGVALISHGSSTGLTPNPGSPSNAARLLEKDQAGASFGYAVASAGDINDDGYSDVIVGAPKYDNGETDEGAVFVYNGSAGENVKYFLHGGIIIGAPGEASGGLTGRGEVIVWAQSAFEYFTDVSCYGIFFV